MGREATPFFGVTGFWISIMLNAHVGRRFPENNRQIIDLDGSPIQIMHPFQIGNYAERLRPFSKTKQKLPTFC